MHAISLFPRPFDTSIHKAHVAHEVHPVLPVSTPSITYYIARRRGLYRGLSLNYLKTMPNVAIYMSLYDFFKHRLVGSSGIGS